MKNISNFSFYKLLKYSPVLLLIFLIVYSFNTHESKNKLDDEFRNEQKILQHELDQIVADYKKMTVKKKGLSRRIITSINKIIALKDSIKEIKRSNYDKLVKYSMRVAKIQRENRKLILQADQLTKQNDSLQDENNEVRKRLRAHERSQKSLFKENAELVNKEKELRDKINPAKKVKIGNITVNAFKERNSGKFTSTSKSSKTDAFKVKFELLENELADAGMKNIIIQIFDKNNELILSDKNRGVNSDQTAYNDYIKVNYENQKLGIVSLISVDRHSLARGDYKVAIYIDNEIAGNGKISLR
ncbi:hypothetical protein BTO06_17190 [Tenacibaculum sp. SZ-18]|uniref:hypothetical protein n=1 Tax=Tenacibaculum sp. SZ-18 TaxID=754423 RepID=UPI000C2D014A|nr:hypothetical protein [Tenacibaculum sp. SZ-18]AUC16772.1 hypothetical protein BTO06_17190 [Tenacibaculum sp. SZ-18]